MSIVIRIKLLMKGQYLGTIIKVRIKKLVSMLRHILLNQTKLLWLGSDFFCMLKLFQKLY